MGKSWGEGFGETSKRGLIHGEGSNAVEEISKSKSGVVIPRECEAVLNSRGDFQSFTIENVCLISSRSTAERAER